jgi:hypothetical protein
MLVKWENGKIPLSFWRECELLANWANAKKLGIITKENIIFRKIPNIFVKGQFISKIMPSAHICGKWELPKRLIIMRVFYS